MVNALGEKYTHYSLAGCIFQSSLACLEELPGGSDTWTLGAVR